MPPRSTFGMMSPLREVDPGVDVADAGAVPLVDRV